MRKIVMLDDLDGESEVAETLPIYFDGVTYVLDLSEEHAAQLREVLEPYLRSAHDSFKGLVDNRSRKPAKVSRDKAVEAPEFESVAAIKRPTRYSVLSRQEKDHVRQWLTDHGYEIGKGTVPNDLLDVYEAAHPKGEVA